MQVINSQVDVSLTGEAGRWTGTSGGKKIWGVSDQSGATALSVGEDEEKCMSRYQYVVVTALGADLTSLDLTLSGEAISAKVH